jgi:hypothetical protein
MFHQLRERNRIWCARSKRRFVDALSVFPATPLRTALRITANWETSPRFRRSRGLNARATGARDEEFQEMKMVLLSAAAALGVAIALPAAAQAQAYVGAGYTHYDTDAGDIGGVTGRVGYRFNPNFAVEGEGTFGVEDDDAVELEHALGAYAVGILPLGQRLDLHGRVGYQATEFDTPFGSADADGVAYGVGATFNVTERFGVRADYTRVEGDLDTDTIGLGGVVKF